MDDPVSYVNIVDRLGRLEGLLVGLQNSIVQGQTQTSAFMARVERLEQRQVELESRQVTKDDLKDLSTKVDNLIKAEATQRGGVSVASWSFSNIVNWLAFFVAVLALIGVGVNRERLLQQPAPAAPPARTP